MKISLYNVTVKASNHVKYLPGFQTLLIPLCTGYTNLADQISSVGHSLLMHVLDIDGSEFSGNVCRWG
jgi:hypothetical protein